MIGIEVEDAEMQRVLRRTINAVERPQPLLKAIGEILVDSTKQRFATSTGPDGKAWAENSDTTILNYLRKYKGTFGKRGGLTKKGMTRLVFKKPLMGETKMLSLRINYKVEGDTLHIGTPQKYGAMQHFGGKKSQFPNLWGDIPARPFLGVSDHDRESILDTMRDFVQGLK